jgi:hypothetical protein
MWLHIKDVLPLPRSPLKLNKRDAYATWMASITYIYARELHQERNRPRKYKKLREKEVDLNKFA